MTASSVAVETTVSSAAACALPARSPRSDWRVRAIASGIAAAALSLLSIGAASAQTIMLTGLPAGTGWITPFTISGDGLVGTGYASNAHSYRWTAADGFEDLGLRAGTYATQAESLSADGSVIVGQTYPLAGRFRAFRWTHASGLVDLGVLPGGDFSYGHGVSRNGLVVVGQANDSSSVYKAYRWSGGVMTPLPPIPNSLLGGATAWGTNFNGSVVVGQDAIGGTDAGYRGFRWTSAGGTQALNPLAGHKSSRAFCVSADGAVIAGVSNPKWIDAPANLVIWSPAGVVTNLGMPANMTEAQPSAISDDGSVIGLLTRTNDGGPRAGMWSAASGTVDLNVYLPTIGIDLAGWVLTRTYGVSGDGRTLVGEGAYHNPDGVYVGGNFVVSLGCLVAPTIANQPDAFTACPSGEARFTVGAGGVGPFTYAWRFGTTPIDPVVNPSAATATLVLTNVQPGDIGSYDCIVTNNCGDVTTIPAALSICAANFNCDGFITFEDFDAFVGGFESGEAAADFNGDGFLTFEDFDVFVVAFEAGC